MKRWIGAGLCGATAFAFVQPAAAEDPARPVASQEKAPRNIRVGDPLRATLLDALRPAIEADLGQKIKFVVRTLRKHGRWAFVVAVPQKLNGKPIDFTRTRYAEQIREGIFDGETIYALLEHHAGRWTVRDFVIGPTDVHYAGWPDEFGVPYTLLDLPQPES